MDSWTWNTFSSLSMIPHKTRKLTSRCSDFWQIWQASMMFQFLTSKSSWRLIANWLTELDATELWHQGVAAGPRLHSSPAPSPITSPTINPTANRWPDLTSNSSDHHLHNDDKYRACTFFEFSLMSSTHFASRPSHFLTRFGLQDNGQLCFSTHLSRWTEAETTNQPCRIQPGHVDHWWRFSA